MPENGEYKESLHDLGLQHISQGKLATIFICGGKGRKIYKKGKPKCLQPYKEGATKSILQIFIERIKSISNHSVKLKGIAFIVI